MTKKTALYDNHIKAGAKMGEFAGYDMPLYYGLGVKKEHEWTREKAGLFDVSHMGQALVAGPDDGRQALDLVQKITPSSFEKLGHMRTKYTVLTDENGGIIDDLMVTRTGDNDFHFVLNAGCKDKDIAWIKSHMDDALEFVYFDDWALLALQGPSAEKVMRDVLNLDFSDLAYMSVWGRDDYKMFVSRLGYTGEDGFEISVPNADAPALWDKLLTHDDVEPVGLAARDSLRLDMAYPLYGHDISNDTTPIEADLGWVVSKNNKGFIGADTIIPQKENGAPKKRIGLKLIDKGIAREGAEIRNQSDEKIGDLTSGGFSPTLNEAIGMGYVPSEYANPGTKIFVNVRGKNIAAEIVPMPFVQAKTKSAKKKAA